MCLKRESNPSSPVCRASTLNIMPWLLGWVGLIRACGAAATCVWSAWAPAILIVSAGNGPNSHAWSTHGTRHTRCLQVDARSDHQVNPLGGACMLVTKNNSGQSVAWTICTVVHPCWTIRLVDNPQVDITIIHRMDYEAQ